MAKRSEKAEPAKANRTQVRRPPTVELAAPAIIDAATSIVAVEPVEYQTLRPLDLHLGKDTLGIASTLAGQAVHGVQVSRSFMNETHGGGSLEQVPGFDASSVLTEGLAQPGSVSWPQLKPPFNGAPKLGEWMPESVLGPDTRRPVPNAAALPWRCVALLQIRYASGQTGQGTGWFIAPRTLITAAHCVFHKQAGAATQIIVTPGYDRGAAPYGQFQVVGSLWNPAWKTSFDPVLDFAMVYIGQDPGVGWFGYAAVPDQNLARVIVNVAGYPKDLIPTQWYDAGRVAGDDQYFIYHAIDTEEGESGAPVFWTNGTQRIGLGIHTYGFSAGATVNRARRISPELYQLFQQNAK